MSRPTHTTRPVWVTAVAVSLLALHWWLGVTGWIGKSVTSDETAHLVSGYSYWTFNDYRLQPENGNLPQRWAALPLLVEKPRLNPLDEPLVWKVSDVWGVGQRFFFESGNNIDFILATARANMALWSVAVGLLVFIWSRKLWGDLGGLFSLTLYTFSATTLAHGPLVTSDMTATFFLIASPIAFWIFLRTSSAKNLVLSCACTGLAAVAKFSFLVLGPTYLLLLGAHVFFHWHAKRAFGSRESIQILGAILAHILVAWIIVWACFGFRYSGFAPGMLPGLKYYYPWDELLLDQPGWRSLLTHAKTWRILPEAYIHGFAYVIHAAQARGAFLAGNYSQTGWWWFFPYAFLCKTPIAELAAYSLAGAAWGWRLFRSRVGERKSAPSLSDYSLPLLAVFLVYWAISIVSHLNIGHRHLLPIYPPLIIFGGSLLGSSAGRWLRISTAALALLAITESTYVRPHYLSFFNAFAGGSSQGWKHLVDSSLDWGQDLPELSAWLKENRHAHEKTYVAYFGMGSPSYESTQSEPLAPYYYHYRPRHWKELEPGLYCISATMLQDPYSPWNGPWTARHETVYQSYLRNMREELKTGKRDTLLDEFGEGKSRPLWDLDRLRFARLCLYLRLREPNAMIANTFLIYRLSKEEVHIVVDGSTDDLAKLMDTAMQTHP